MSLDPKSKGSPSPGHERRDVTFRLIVFAAIGLVIALAVAVVGMERLFDYLAARTAQRGEPASPLAAAGRQVPPEPRLQTAPIEDLRALRAREQSLLDGYGWVDTKSGVVRIPIARAMELLLQRMPHDGSQTEPPES